MLSKASHLAGLLLLLAVGTPFRLEAQTARSGGGASSQLVLQIQQITAERSRLTAENAKLEQDLAALKTERDGLKKTQESVERKVRSSVAAITKAEEERDRVIRDIDATKAQTQELVDTFRETLKTLRDTETDSNTLKQTLNVLDRKLKVCVNHDVELYRLDSEVLARLVPLSVWRHLARDEPFTRIGRIREENAADDYRARAKDLRIEPPVDAVSAGSEAGAAPSGAPRRNQ